MLLKRFTLLLFLLLALPCALHAQSYDKMRVAKITIIPEGLSPDAAFNSTAVEKSLCTKVGSLFSQNEFDADLKELSEEYDRIDPSIAVEGNELYIILRLWMKPLIHNIYVCGNQRVSEKKLLKKLEIEPGCVYDREEFIEAFNTLRLFYAKKGYFEAEVDYTVIPLDNGEVDIRIDVCEGRSGHIQEICFCGLSSCEEDELMDLMLTKRYNVLLSWYSGRGIYHPEMVEHDRMQITNYFQNLGYADAVVDICVEEAPKCSRIIVVISVEKGERYTIGNLNLEGNCIFDNQCIWDQFAFGIGSCYSPEAIRTTVRNITDLYGARGYIDASVDMQLLIRDNCPIYDIQATIDEGEQYTIGLIKVFGNCTTQTSVILHECLLCPGEVFDIRRLEGTEARLRNTGYFCNVNVYAVNSQIDDPCGDRLYRDIYIEVEETDTGNLGLFFGFSSLDRVFGGVEITERNFNVAGLTHLFQSGPGALRGGGEYIHAKINIGDRLTSYLLQWTKPYFFDTPWIVGFDLEKDDNRALSRGYELKTYGGTVHGTYIWNEYLKYSVHYRARHTNINIVDSSNVLLNNGADNTGFISAVGASAIYDSTDNPRRARCGVRSRLDYEIAGLGGNYQYMRFGYLNTYYYPLTKKGTLKTRGDLQFIKTYGSTRPTSLPMSERFYLGGETTVRGYRPYIIGPKFGNNEPAGGVSSLLLSEEYMHNLLDAPCIDGFVFVDAGYISLSEFTLGRYAASVGFGIRLEVMRNMPLMMGVGWPIHPTENFDGRQLNNAQRFFFSVGGTF